MKKLIYFLVGAVLLFGIVGGVNADNYTLSYNTVNDYWPWGDLRSDNDLTIPGSTAASFTVTGTSTAGSTSIFDSATLKVILDKDVANWSGNNYSSYLKAYFDTSGTQVSYASETSSGVTYDSEGGTHYLVTFTNFTNVADFANDNSGTNHWYDNSLLMNIKFYDSKNLDLDSASLTVNYHNIPAPEPTTILLLGFGLVGLAGFARRKVRK